MYSPFRKKVVVTKKKKGSNGRKNTEPDFEYETSRHYEERKKFIEQFGIERFDKETGPGKTFEKFVDIPIPNQYSYIWEHFIYIWSQSDYDMNGNKIFTFGTVKEYQDLFGYDFSPNEIKLFFKMKNWAVEIVSELNKN